MKKILSIIILLLLTGCLFAQNVVLTFTGRNIIDQYIPLSRVVITNVTQNWQETIYYPDTIYNMSLVGIDERDADLSFLLSNNMPNPFEGTTAFKLQLPESGKVHVEISDLNGRKVATYENELSAGSHLFQAQLSTPQSYVLTARSGKYSASMKIMNTGSSNENQIKYIGETIDKDLTVQLKNDNKNDVHPFQLGDQMEYVGYAEYNEVEWQSQMIQREQFVSENFIFQFMNIPEFTCGTSTIADQDGNIYNTVQIGNQCWMKENLRTTKYSDGTTIALGSTTSMETAYRYYPDNNSNNVATYGYLYNWKAVMHNSSSSSTNPSGVHGICPTGWHVPSDAEWTQLTNYVSDQSAYQCDDVSYNIAKALASIYGWNSNTTTCAVGNNQSTNNATGFSAVPAGYYISQGSGSFGYDANFWSTTQYDSNDAYYRKLSYNRAYVSNSASGSKRSGYSVRCLKD